MEYKIVGEFLADIRKEFRGGDEESVRVSELKKIEQRERMMKECVQEFKRAARGSEYKKRLLIEKFKRGINMMI